jgi:serine protease Do
MRPQCFNIPLPPAPSRPPQRQARGPETVAMLPDFSGIVAANGPAVVNISITNKGENDVDVAAVPQIDPNDPFYQYFRRFRIPMPQGQIPMRGIGSGFIVSPDGVILTNAHVVDGASTVTVKLTDKREFTAKVIGSDRPSDVAVLKISAENLPIVKLDPADDVKVGEWVVAIGSPFGFENSATSGIVSAKSRTLPGGSYVPFIQTDVAGEPGQFGWSVVQHER